MTTRKARSAAAATARQLLQDRVDAVADLAEAGTCIDAMAAAVAEAERALHDARAGYRDRYSAAIALGWTDEQLAQTGCSAERGNDVPRGRGRVRRRRSDAATNESAAASGETSTPGWSPQGVAPDEGPRAPAGETTLTVAS